MVDPTHARLSVRQCRLVSVARSSFYYEGTGESPLNLRLLRGIDAQFLETPFYGSRQMTRSPPSGRHGLAQTGAPPDATAGGARDLPTAQDVSGGPGAQGLSLPVTRSADHATEPRVVHGSYLYPIAEALYLVAVIWASRKVLSWRLSNTLDARFCVDAFTRRRALWPSGDFNTTKAANSPASDFTDVLTELASASRWRQGPLDNVFIERLWLAQYECATVRVRNRFPGSDRHRWDGLLRPARPTRRSMTGRPGGYDGGTLGQQTKPLESLIPP